MQYFPTKKTENADNMPYRLAQVGVAFELQCLRNCTLSSFTFIVVYERRIILVQMSRELCEYACI